MSETTKKVTEYKLMSGTTESELEHAVAEAIQHGWQPIGGVSCVHAPPTHWSQSWDRFTQAMVR